MADADAPISVLVADDQALVRAGFRAILDAQPGITVCGEASDGRDAVDLARRRRPDVVLMDIRMPDLDGLEATRRILAEAGGHPTAVLMLTTFDLNEYVYERCGPERAASCSRTCCPRTWLRPSEWSQPATG